MPSLKELYRQREELESRAREITKQIGDAKARTMLCCKGCRKRTRVSSVTYIQTYWYERPYGCTGGDNWHEGEGQWDCPKCGYNNRLITFERDEKGKRKTHPTVYLKPYFKDVTRKNR